MALLSPDPAPFPEPMMPRAGRAEVFLSYFDFFRDRLVAKLSALPETELRGSRLPSGWTPIEMVMHLRHVERRWLEWGFEGRDVGEPWADQRDGQWFVPPETSFADVVEALRSQAARTREIVMSHDLSEVGQPGDRWDGKEPATLERVLFHLLQEYARHLGHIDIVTELAGGDEGE